ncbi:Exodeoxyribonuclease V beta chain [Serinicoccus hydrothermalis]|uniref:RecBCD enzyme subunit RecB n=1 Tax=Serinicoccus hydrothermalis TaxID=1758689 RepID=A0A1B1NEG6_9MICO|nr:UvrD-helicase domain-containing protein [Serinicoccus hydrothermalis]ANS79745.1 Exodeoxyribonuclease V beta chain [Serinicoccus hydrothermalis]
MTALAHFSIADPLPTGTVLLEASAGTGKTWTIAALVTRYVAEGVVLLPEMLVVTFGRAASQELRARVREQLVAAERALTEPPPPQERDELLTLLLDVDEEERAARRRRLRTALSDIDAATIATTHQFCQQVLRSLGVAGTADADAELVDDLDRLLVEVVDDLYLRAFAQREDEPFFSRREALQIARTVVDDVHAELRPDGAEPRSVPDRRVRFAHAVRHELGLRKQRLQVMHYNDLLTQLAEALEEPSSPARVRMRRRWRVVLVDEFQDTDPIQWSVLERAFSGHAHAMVLIGDPKQAIYAFRGGDVPTYLTAAATAADRRTLPRNFRSDPGVTQALGAMLTGTQLGDEEILVHPVTADREGSRLVGAPSTAPVRLRQVLLRDHLGGDSRMPTVRPWIARDLAHDVAALLASGATFEGRPVQARDVAVLAHRGKDLVAARDALAELGIPAVTTGGSTVLHSRAAHDWLALLEAMVAPHRPVLTRAAALTDLLGYAVARVGERGERADAELEDELAQTCRELAGVYARQGIAAVLELLTIQGLPDRVLGQVGGERSLTDLRHVAQLLHETARRDQLGLVALLEWLRAGMAQDAPQSAGARTRRLDSDAAAVQLATIHGSKGLQYPVVYLPSLGDRWVSDSPTIPLFHESPPERTRCLDVGGEHAANPGWADSVRRHKEEDAGESLRLLYVAMTRAQSQVVTWWAPVNNASSSALHRVLFGREPGQGEVPQRVRVPRQDDAATEHLRRWADQGAFALERADPATDLAPALRPTAPELRLAMWSRRIDHDWRRTSYTALSTPAESGPGVAGVGSEPEVGLTGREDEPSGPDPVAESTPALPGLDAVAPPAGSEVPSPMAELPVGATFGSLVHAVLEHADPQAADLHAELARHLHEQKVLWPVELDQAGEDLLVDALVAVCDTPLGPLAGGTTLRRIGTADRLCELDFELPLGGGDLRRGPSGEAAVLGDLAPLLREHLPPGDPVRAWADVLDAAPDLAGQELRGYLTGSVDVVLRVGGGGGETFLVADYKTNWLGSPEEALTAADYRPERLAEAMGHSSYPLQALLYAVVAHRFLRWRLAGYDPEQHLGGVLYLYLRGMCGPDTPVVDGMPCGVFSWRPPVDLVLGLSDLLDGAGRDVEVGS